jgi:hypothetical protein
VLAAVYGRLVVTFDVVVIADGRLLVGVVLVVVGVVVAVRRADGGHCGGCVGVGYYDHRRGMVAVADIVVSDIVVAVAAIEVVDVISFVVAVAAVDIVVEVDEAVEVTVPAVDIAAVVEVVAVLTVPAADAADAAVVGAVTLVAVTVVGPRLEIRAVILRELEPRHVRRPLPGNPVTRRA